MADSGVGDGRAVGKSSVTRVWPRSLAGKRLGRLASKGYKRRPEAEVKGREVAISGNYHYTHPVRERNHTVR